MTHWRAAHFLHLGVRQGYSQACHWTCLPFTVELILREEWFAWSKNSASLHTLRDAFALRHADLFESFSFCQCVPLCTTESKANVFLDLLQFTLLWTTGYLLQCNRYTEATDLTQDKAVHVVRALKSLSVKHGFFGKVENVCPTPRPTFQTKSLDILHLKLLCLRPFVQVGIAWWDLLVEHLLAFCQFKEHKPHNYCCPLFKCSRVSWCLPCVAHKQDLIC